MDGLPPKKKIKLQDLGHYFDSEKKTQLDQAAIDMKSAEWLKLRQRLLTLPLNEFSAVMASINALVDQMARHGDGVGVGSDGVSPEAHSLYDATGGSNVTQTSATPKVSSV